MYKKLILSILTLLLLVHGKAQKEFVYTKEGKRILKREPLITNCLHSLHKDRSDATALSICECQIDKIDGHFTNSEYRKNSSDGLIDLAAMMKLDSLFEKQIQDCYTASGKTALMEAEGFESQYIKNCVKNIWKDSHKELDSANVTNFCSCQLEMVKQKKLTDAEMATLSDPNSLLFYDMVYNCGDPFSVRGKIQTGWTDKIKLDVEGPLSDTTSILAIDGMNYIKVKIGSLIKVWLFDTGASDMLINKEMEDALKQDNIISEKNYLGVGDYEMANGLVESCRKYKVDNIKIGKYILNNIVVSVTEKGKRIIVGKSLINKFSHWEIDNRINKLILTQ